MNMTLSPEILRGKKTHIIGVLMAIQAAVLWYYGDIGAAQAIPEILNGLGFIAVRLGLSHNAAVHAASRDEMASLLRDLTGATNRSGNGG